MRRVLPGGPAVAVLMTSMLMAQIPTPTIVKKSPALDALIAARRGVREAGRRLQVDRGAGLEHEGRLPALLRHPEQRHQQVGAGQGHVGVPEAERLHGAAPFTGPEPGTNGLTFDAARPAGRLPARRSPGRRGARTGRGRRWPTSTRASASTAPTTSSSTRPARSTSPIRRTACPSAGTTRRRNCPSRASIAAPPTARSRCSPRR